MSSSISTKKETLHHMIKRLNQQLTIERANKHKINSINRQIDPNVQILQF